MKLAVTERSRGDASGDDTVARAALAETARKHGHRLERAEVEQTPFCRGFSACSSVLSLIYRGGDLGVVDVTDIGYVER
ncbi:hypothetical protein [Halorubrum salsamenti]|uniref:hypothetical protein n=1 Tax=Halorubrum salsamenti TaxID=2583990 RepID=UPI0011A47F2C|nr:hypothetical protein [Halorubrum salsamenti]